VEHGAVVLSFLHVLQEVLDRLRRLGRVKFQANGAEVRAQIDLRIGGQRAGGPFPKDVPTERVFIKSATIVATP